MKRLILGLILLLLGPFPSFAYTSFVNGVEKSGHADTATLADIATLASTVTVVDTTDSTAYLALFDSATGSLAAKTDSGATYNASTRSVYISGSVFSSTAFVPNGADGATLGTAALEFSDLYLADGGVIYFQNDQSVYLTPSAGALTLTGAFGATSSTIPWTSMPDGTDGQVPTFDADGHPAFVDTGDAGYVLTSNGAGAAPTFQANGASALADDATYTFGTGIDYWWIYNSTDTRYELWTSDSDGGGTDAVVFYIEDGTKQVTFPTGSSIDGLSSISVTGPLLGGVNIVKKGNVSYTIGTDDANEAYGSLIINTGAPTYTLPTATEGMSMCFMQGQGRTDIITVTPASGDYLVVDGARGTAATAYASAGAANEKLCIVAGDSDDWYVTAKVGTWSE